MAKSYVEVRSKLTSDDGHHSVGETAKGTGETNAGASVGGREDLGGVGVEDPIHQATITNRVSVRSGVKGFVKGLRHCLLLGERDGTGKAKIARLRGDLRIAEEEDTRKERRHAQGSPSANPLLLYYPTAEKGARNPTDRNDSVVRVGGVKGIISSGGSASSLKVNGQEDIEQVVTHANHAPDQNDDGG